MPLYTLPVLGLEVSIKTDADADRVYAAQAYVESLYDQLNQGGKNISKEKLLTVLALSLADDYLQSKKRMQEIDTKLGKLLGKI